MLPTAQEAKLRARQVQEQRATARIAALARIITDAIDRGDYGVVLKQVDYGDYMVLVPELEEKGYILRPVSKVTHIITVEVSWNGNQYA